MSRQDKNKGFTIIELTLAMAFVSLLLVAIAMTVIQIANIYAKGSTLKEVNQLGMALSQDMQSSISSSSPLSLGEGSPDFKEIKASGDSSKVAGGRLCTGNISYIWNFGEYFTTPVNEYETSSDVLRLVKVEDKGKLYCSDPTKKVVKANATEMLMDGEREVALQSFAITEAAHDAVLQQGLYKIVLEVGTNDQAALETTTTSGAIDSVDTSCKAPSDEAAYQDYCAVNKFEFTARAGNRGAL